MRRTSTALLVLLLGLVLSGCAEDPTESPVATPESTTESTGPTQVPEGPACEEVWVDDQDLPRRYDGCVEDSAWVAADSRRCESGQIIVIYADRFYGAKGAVVNDMGGSLEDSQQYQRAARSCG